MFIGINNEIGVVNKLQWWVLVTWDSRTLLTTPDGHAIDRMPKS